MLLYEDHFKSTWRCSLRIPLLQVRYPLLDRSLLTVEILRGLPHRLQLNLSAHQVVQLSSGWRRRRKRCHLVGQTHSRITTTQVRAIVAQDYVQQHKLSSILRAQ